MKKPAAPGETSGTATPASVGRPLVCIVDDDESVRLAVGALLRSVGFDIRAHASGGEFLLHRPDCRCSCLIVDLRMKGMSGLELQRELARAGDRTPVIFISAHGDDEARQRALAAGSVGFLAKPFDEGALLDLVRSAVGTRH